MRWDGSPAEKKSVINNANFVFSASPTVDLAIKAKEALKSQGVNYKLLHCSDAHTYINDLQDTKEKELGHCFTWIKADPTFEGLKQIIYEPEERVFIGDKPPILEIVDNNKTKYIKSLIIKRINKKGDIWFDDINIDFNNELVSIIGNKGNGKSAIADIIGFLGNSHNDKDFSFLIKDRFKKNGLADNFEGKLLFADGIDRDFKNLGADNIDKNSPERVRYLPQNFFNNLTNNLDINEFTKTLENVIFSHVNDFNRLGKNNFEELIEYKTNIINSKIFQFKSNLSGLVKELVNLEKTKHKDRISELRANILEKENEEKSLDNDLKELEKHKPQDLTQNETETKEYNKIGDLINQLKELESEISTHTSEYKDFNEKLEKFENLRKRIILIEKQFIDIKGNNEAFFEELGINYNDIIKININRTIIDNKIDELNNQILIKKNILGYIKDNEIIPKDSFNYKKIQLEKQINDIKDQLTQKQKEYQKYIEKKEDTTKRLLNTRYSLNIYREKLDYLIKENDNGKTKIDIDIDNKLLQLFDILKNIFYEKTEIFNIYNSLKQSIDKHVENGNFDDVIKPNISVSYKNLIITDEKLLSFISKNVAGSFYGKDESMDMLKNIVNGYDFSSLEGICNFITEILTYLKKDKREGFNDVERDILNQVKDLEGFYKYLFGLDYIDIVYELKSGDRKISQLSPGEKGILLLIFYLVIDKENIPLIIDQPEDNLDNQSVFNILSKYIKQAKKYRQIIIVTHNPNLAVGADAEQIIFTQINKNHDNEFSFKSGSIENPIINQHIIDILEGTKPAFDKRKLKYFNS